MPRTIEKMTKEELIEAVKSYGCGKLRTLPLEYLSKEQIVKHLVNCECPMLRKLMRGQV